MEGTPPDEPYVSINERLHEFMATFLLRIPEGTTRHPALLDRVGVEWPGEYGPVLDVSYEGVRASYIIRARYSGAARERAVADAKLLRDRLNL